MIAVAVATLLPLCCVRPHRCCVPQAQASKQVEALQAVRQEAKQLQQQVAADLAKQQQEVQQLLTRHSADVARDTIKQFRADQVSLGWGACSRAWQLPTLCWASLSELVAPGQGDVCPA